VEVVIVPGPDEAGKLVGGAVADLVAGRPHAVLGLATGASPLPVYRDLARRHAAGELSLADGRLPTRLVRRAPHRPSPVVPVVRRPRARGPRPPRLSGCAGPDVHADDLPAACSAYEEAIRAAGGVDLQLLVIGTEGHIGFNEPGSSLASRTRLKTLTEQTRADNARFFGSPDEVPCHVITQGVGTILEARHLVLLAFGAAKAAALTAAVEVPSRPWSRPRRSSCTRTPPSWSTSPPPPSSAWPTTTGRPGPTSPRRRACSWRPFLTWGG
jgi:glucosamine-6-phosphate deaminase